MLSSSPLCQASKQMTFVPSKSMTGAGFIKMMIVESRRNKQNSEERAECKFHK